MGESSPWGLETLVPQPSIYPLPHVPPWPLLPAHTSPIPGRRKNEYWRVRQEMSICQKAEFSPLGLKNCGWRLEITGEAGPETPGLWDLLETQSESQGLQESWGRKSP